MVSVDEARVLAEELLAHELPRRFSHARGVASQAERLASTATDEGSLLVAAAWLHDIGYASALVDTGFHPIDGARYLRRRGGREGREPRGSSLVRRIEAGLRGLEEC